ncbi:hypothetical protein EDB92DRAFT_2102916 [Lactarius akahatsu]|uniref:Uncharacterized protein n=1 Tax=Lactarius akahatsu TaxID=416441 RepID=A0AAD4LJG8_9AGAM|nr:hypothetical protein EDB92DRAFT_2102916 [Lactarius akahatsu]
MNARAKEIGGGGERRQKGRKGRGKAYKGEEITKADWHGQKTNWCDGCPLGKEAQLGIGDASRETASCFRLDAKPHSTHRGGRGAYKTDTLAELEAGMAPSPRQATGSWRRMMNSDQALKGRDLHRAVMRDGQNHDHTVHTRNSSAIELAMKVAGSSPKTAHRVIECGRTTPGVIAYSEVDTARWPCDQVQMKYRLEKSPCASSGGATSFDEEWTVANPWA